MVQDPCGGLALELLLLQDALEVLHALLRVLHVSRQVTVQEADSVAEHRHAGADSAFIPLETIKTQNFIRSRDRETKAVVDSFCFLMFPLVSAS